LHETASIAGRLAARALKRGQEMAAARFEERESRQHAETLRGVLLRSPHPEEQNYAQMILNRDVLLYSLFYLERLREILGCA
jgi:hypothetical protein